MKISDFKQYSDADFQNLAGNSFNDFEYLKNHGFFDRHPDVDEPGLKEFLCFVSDYGPKFMDRNDMFTDFMTGANLDHYKTQINIAMNTAMQQLRDGGSEENQYAKDLISALDGINETLENAGRKIIIPMKTDGVSSVSIEDVLRENGIDMDTLNEIANDQAESGFEFRPKTVEAKEKLNKSIGNVSADLSEIDGIINSIKNGDGTGAIMSMISGLCKEVIKHLMSSINETKELLSNSSMFYSKEEVSEMMKTGNFTNPLDDLEKIEDGNIAGMINDANEATESVAEARKIGMRECEKTDAEIEKAMKAISYADAVYETKADDLKNTPFVSEADFTEADAKKAEEILKNAGADIAPIKDLTSYADAMKLAASIDVAKHPIGFAIYNMKSAIMDTINGYRDAKAAVKEADIDLYNGLDGLKKIASDTVTMAKTITLDGYTKMQNGYSVLASSAASTAKEFVENAALTAENAWKKMADLAVSTRSFLKAQTKALVLTCDRALERFTGGRWSQFCMKVEKKAADMINRQHGMELQRDVTAKRSERFHTLFEKCAHDVLAKPGDELNLNKRIQKDGDRVFGKVVESAVEKLAYAAASAHSWITTDKGLNFEIGTDKQSGKLYAFVGESVKDENGNVMKDLEGKEMVREGNSYWRDVRSDVWGVGQPAPADALIEAGENFKAALKSYEAKRDDVIANADKFVSSIPSMAVQAANRVKDGVANGLEAYENALNKASDFAEKNVISMALNAQAACMEAHASVKASALSLTASAYEGIAKLASNHMNRLSEKIEMFTAVDKKIHGTIESLSKLYWNLMETKPYQVQDYQVSPKLLQQKETLMAMEPSSSVSYRLEHVNKLIRKEMDAFYNKEGDKYQASVKDITTETDRVREARGNLKEKSTDNLMKLGKAQDRFRAVEKFIEKMQDKAEEKVAEAIEVKKNAKEAIQTMKDVAEQDGYTMEMA